MYCQCCCHASQPIFNRPYGMSVDMQFPLNFVECQHDDKRTLLSMDL